MNYQKTQQVLQENGWNYPAILCKPEECVNCGIKLEKEGVNMIITFGMFSKVIREHVNIPVIPIDITYKNFTEALVRAAEFGRRIGIIGFQNKLKDLSEIHTLLKVDLIQLPTVAPEKMPEVMSKLQKMNVDVVIGGGYQTSLAEAYGMKSVLIETETKDIKDAIINARAFISEIKEGPTAEESISELHFGVFTVDQNGRVVVMNRLAAEYLGVIGKDASEFNIRDICVPMMTDIHNAIREERESVNRIVNLDGRTMLYTVFPMKRGGKICGAVVSIQDAREIQRIETRIRKTLTAHDNRAKYYFDDIIGTSESLRKAVFKAFKYAWTDQTVLITGESGTGKELFAQGIHNASRRKNAPFVAINCAALPENILESELFGYVKGAFTGARREGKQGLFETAHTGTIFLDEIGEISYEMQGKLLRVLQEKTIRKLGDNDVIPVDVRVIIATNKDLVKLVREGKFRDDLYFRINVLRLDLPPLRERGEDVLLLAEEFLKKASVALKRNFRLAQDAKVAIMSYKWPGNVRELENMISRITVISDTDEIGAELVKEYIKENSAFYQTDEVDEALPNMYDARPRHARMTIEEALAAAGGNRSKAAELMGVSRATFYRYLNKER